MFPPRDQLADQRPQRPAVADRCQLLAHFRRRRVGHQGEAVPRPQCLQHPQDAIAHLPDSVVVSHRAADIENDDQIERRSVGAVRDFRRRDPRLQHDEPAEFGVGATEPEVQRHRSAGARERQAVSVVVDQVLDDDVIGDRKPTERGELPSSSMAPPSRFRLGPRAPPPNREQRLRSGRSTTRETCAFGVCPCPADNGPGPPLPEIGGSCPGRAPNEDAWGPRRHASKAGTWHRNLSPGAGRQLQHP